MLSATGERSKTSVGDELFKKFVEKKAHIGVIGIGYVGLPLLLGFGRLGFPVTGFDLDDVKVDKLMRGESYINHITPESIREVLSGGSFRATNRFDTLGEMDAILVCVPTPLTRNREPDLSYVVSTAESIARHLRRGQLIVLESTTYPGTTAEVVKPILEARGLKSGRDYYLAYSPEREDPGNKKYSTADIAKVIGGDGEVALNLAKALYEQLVTRTVPVSSLATAEAVKLTENIFRAVNIALVNELKVVFGRMGIDIWEVIEAAKTKPFGYMPFYPGPGLGGHCIPIDPFYLTWKAREYHLSTRFIELAGEINTAMPAFVVATVGRALNDRMGKSVKGSRVLVVGIAYKKNVSDLRESPALELIELLEEQGALVEYLDPFIPTVWQTREHGPLAGRKSVGGAPAQLGPKFDVALICTDHDDIDYQGIVDHFPLIIDTRNVTAALRGAADKVVKS